MNLLSSDSRTLGWILSAIALPSILTACTTVAQTSSTTSPSASPMHHGDMTHTSMDLGPADADYDLRFIDAMIPHHEGAILMAKDVLQKSKQSELRQLATTIISAQEKEIKQMQDWRKNWYPKASNTPMAWSTQMNHMMAMSPDQMKGMQMDMDLGVADQGYALRFVNAMIPHHEAAVVMADDVLKKSKRPELLKLAKAIIASQQAEIDQMKQWKTSGFGT
jgi:uncharacterized protein (DUF305 family)